MKIRMIIESTWHGPSKRDGVAMWLMEYMKDDIPITRQGFIHKEDGTEAAGCLMAMINAFHMLRVPCDVEIITQCDNVLNTMGNHWHIQWKKNDWHNAKGKEVRNKELWELLTDKMDPHTYTIHGGHHDYQTVMQAAVQKEFEEWSKGK